MAKVMLTSEMSLEEAGALVSAKKVPFEAYQEWLADREKSKNGRASKAESQISKKDFLDKAKTIQLTIDGQTFDLDPRVFSKGSFGFGYYGKVNIKVGNQALKCQASISLTVAGSKGSK